MAVKPGKKARNTLLSFQAERESEKECTRCDRLRKLICSWLPQHSGRALGPVLLTPRVRHEGWQSFHVASQEQASRSPGKPCFDSRTAGWEVRGSCSTAVRGELPHHGQRCSQRCCRGQRPWRAPGLLLPNAHVAVCKFTPDFQTY